MALKQQQKCVLQLIIQKRKLPTMSAVSVFGFPTLKHKKKSVLQLKIKIWKLPTMSAVSVFWLYLWNWKKKCVLQLIIQIRKNCRQCWQFPYLDSCLLNTEKMRLAVDNPNTVTAFYVGSFLIWIIGSEQQKKYILQLIIQIRKLATMSKIADNVGSFRIWIIGS